MSGFGSGARRALAVWTICCAGLMAAELTGEVADEQARTVAGVSVRATHAETRAQFTTATNAAGVYRLAALPVGRYSLVFSRAGFRDFEMAAVDLHVGEERKADVRLAVEERVFAVTVAETDSAVSRAVLKDEIQNLPLNGRQLQNLALLAPGVAAGWNWSTAANRYGKARENLEGAFNVNGARGRSNNFSLDGISFNLRQYGVINFEPSVEAVEEFRMVTGSPAAGYGGTMGPSVTRVARSGGGRFEWISSGNDYAIDFAHAAWSGTVLSVLADLTYSVRRSRLPTTPPPGNQSTSGPPRFG